MKKRVKKTKGACQCLILAIIALELYACGSTGGERRSIETDMETVEMGTDDLIEDSEEDSMEKEVSGKEKIENEGGGQETIEEQILFEENSIRITALEMVEDSIWGEGVKLLIENDLDKNIGVGCNALIVNDYMISDLFSTSVAAGKKANETIYIFSNQLEAAGINNIGQIEIYFHIYDSDSWDTLFDSGPVIIKTSAYESMDSVAKIEGQDLYVQDGIRIVGQYVDENSFWGTAVLLYIENFSDKKISISCDNMSVNGFMVSPFFSSTIYDGKKVFDEITLFSSDLEENGIESVEDIEVNFHIYDAETYDTIADTGAISFHVN